MGLKRVNPDFKWSDYDTLSFTVTEWQERGDWLTYQGMRHKESGAPHGVAKLTVRDGDITEGTFKNGKKYGLVRQTFEKEVHLYIYGDDEEILGRFDWDENFQEIFRGAEGLNDLGTVEFAPNDVIKGSLIKKRCSFILDYWFGFEDNPQLMENYDRDTSLPKEWLS